MNSKQLGNTFLSASSMGPSLGTQRLLIFLSPKIRMHRFWR